MLAWQGLERNEWLVEIRAALAAGRALPIPPPSVPGPLGLADPEGVDVDLRAATVCEQRPPDIFKVTHAR